MWCDSEELDRQLTYFQGGVGATCAPFYTLGRWAVTKLLYCWLGLQRWVLLLMFILRPLVYQ